MAHVTTLYRETRLTPTPASASHILDIDTAGGSFLRQSLTRAGSKRPFDDISGKDEDSYARKHLATEGSVFFRSKARSPRNFLWRVLDDRKVLEIQAVDLVKDKGYENTDSWLTFRVAIKDGIVEKGVQFADPEETDALECFVLTEGKELLTVTLKRDLLTRASAPSEFHPSTCVKRYSSSSLSVQNPYRFHAISSLELLVSLADGGLVHLQRKANESGAQWRETFFSEGGWRGTLTLKGFNPFAGRPTVRYGNLELDPIAIADMAMSPDGKYVWTVSLDHTLRAWSTTTGKVVMKQDMLREPGPRDGRQPYTMSAEQGRLLQIVTVPLQAEHEESLAVSRLGASDRYTVVVHSPKDHQFKSYDVEYTYGQLVDGVRLEDLFANDKLAPPVDELLNTNIWHLEHFHMQPGRQWSNTQVWIRVRSGALCQTFVLTVDMDGDEVKDTWASGWSMVDAGPTTIEHLKDQSDYPGDFPASVNSASTPSERWLNFLFYPDRFTPASMETALHVYRKGRGLSGMTTNRALKASEQPLEERITAAVTSKIILRRLVNEQPDYQRYHNDINAQWEAFWSVLAHLHNRRHEPVGFAFDAASRMPWGVCSDIVAPVRACSGLEKRSTNTHLLYDNAIEAVYGPLYNEIYPDRVNPHDKSEAPGDSALLSRLLISAHELRSTLSPGANEKLQATARRSALKPREPDSEEQRALLLFEESGMEHEITDDAFGALSVGLESFGGISGLTDDTFLSLLGWLDDQTRLSQTSDGHALGRYGVTLTIDVARDMLMHAEDMMLDLLALIAFMIGDLEEGELDDDFHADFVYDAIVARLSKIQLLLWLAGHRREKTTNVARNPSEHEIDITGTVTLLEDIFIGDWAPSAPKSNVDMPQLLTLWDITWLGGIQLDDKRRWIGATTHILSRLVKVKEVALALDFLQFVDGSEHWSTYVQGRLRVLTGEYAQASIDFQTAAEGLGAGRMSDTANLIHSHEQEAFGNGEAAYFQHIAAMFETLKVYSYVADFARLALDHTEPLPDFKRSMRKLDKQKSQQDCPTLDRLDAAHAETRLLQLKETRDEILNRLFNALVLTGRFDEACAALMQIEDSPVKRAGLKKLVDGCVKQGCVPALLALPFSKDVVHDVDKVLLDLAQRDLASGASNTTPAYYQILYASRTQRSDFRGAAEILYEHLERLRNTPHHRAAQDPEDEMLLQCYVLLINTLASCGEGDGWVLAEPLHGLHREGTRRKLVTVADVRREYTAEMDRRSEMLQGRFPVVGGGDAMDFL